MADEAATAAEIAALAEHIQGIIREAQKDPAANPWQALAHIDVFLYQATGVKVLP
jgi:hypothetical protein